MGYKNEMINICAKTYLLYGNKKYANWDVLRQFSTEDLLPSRRQLREWGISGSIKKIIKRGEIKIDELGIFTNSFISGLRDSGIFHHPLNRFRFNKDIYKEFLLDLLESKLPVKISKSIHNQINISNCVFLWLGVNGEYQWNEYFGGLFTGCRIVDINNEKCLLIAPKSKESFNNVTSMFNSYKIAHEVKNGQIYISPFYGALFYKYMPIHSANKIINVKNAYMGSKLALVYWNMVREIGQPVAPTKARILPFAKSYATHWNLGMIRKTNIRKMGVDIGVLDISSGLRDLLKEWIIYHS